MYRRNANPVLEALGELSILRGCPRGELETVESHTTSVRVLAGSLLCREGEYGQEAFIIVEGEAEVTIGDTTVARLGVPVTVVYGTADTIVPPAQSERVADAVPHLVEQVVLPGVGHNDPPMFGRPVVDAMIRLAAAARS